MKKISKLFLFSALTFVFMTSACSGQQGVTPTLSGTSIEETTTPFGGLGTPIVGTATTSTVETASIATTGSETLTASGAQGVSTQVTSVVGSPVVGASQTPGIPVTGSDITLVDCQFCVDNLAHAWLVLPDTATFQVVSPTASTNTTINTSCSTNEVNNGKQVVLCSGPEKTPLTLNICTNGTTCTNFPVNLLACPLSQQSGTAVPNETQSASGTGAGSASATPTSAISGDTATPVTIINTPTP